MNIKRHMALVVGGGICLVLLIGALVVLFRFQGEYARVTGELAARRQRLEQLHLRDPYPSADNVERLTKNRATLKHFFRALMTNLGRGQVNVQAMEPADFRQLLDSTLHQLQVAARTNGVGLPPQFPFGFERYQRGLMPDPKHIGRLAVQLKTVDRVCRLLYEAKVSEIESITRETFDETQEIEAPVDSGRRRGAAPPPTVAAAPPDTGGGLYQKEMLTVNFLAREPAAWTVLNKLAANPLFTVAREVEMTNEKKVGDVSGAPTRVTAAAAASALAGPRPVATPGLAPELAAPPPPAEHKDRLIAGTERVRVRIRLAVYRFVEPPPGEEAPAP
jgi:hypothetical protein